MTEEPVVYEIRNKKYNRFGTIDVEWFHPELNRWIEYTADPNDLPDYAAAIHAQALAEGDIAPYVAPTIDELRATLETVTRRQLRLALVRNGTSIATVDAAIAALPDGQAKQEAEIEWADATYFERLHPTIIAVGDALGLTPEQIDTLWIEAQQI